MRAIADFRGDSAAASLKQVKTWTDDKFRSLFPRRFRRGLIEARLSRHGAAHPWQFPRRFRRGLIEATYSRRCIVGISSDFRGDSAAASLKQGTAPMHQRRCRHFRGDSAAASLKPGSPYNYLNDLPDFRGDSAAASLKLTYDRRLQRRQWIFPRRFRRGLIEAYSLRASYSFRYSYFRGDSAAASLKPP